MPEQTATGLELTTEERAMIRQIAEKHGALHVRVFGSWARGQVGPKSDIDLLVEKAPVTTPWFPAGLILELEEALGPRGRCCHRKGLIPELRERILQEAVPL